MSGLTSVDGLISGLDTTEIIDSIMAVERRPVTLLEARRERYTNQSLGYQNVTAKLLAVKANADALASASTFDARVTTSSDTTIIEASAAARTPVGTHELTVARLARNHQVASQGFADIDETTVGTGDLLLTVNGETTTVTIASDTTLEGLRDAINLAGSDVRATIVNDGGATTPYRLLLASANTGEDYQISITNNLTGGTTPQFSANSLTDPVADDANTYSGTATAAGTYTGTAGATYIVEIVSGGDIGAATYRVSEDGGNTWGTTQTLTATIDVYDDVNGSDLGAQMSFTAGTFAAGDTFTMRAFVPTVQQPQDALVYMGSGDGRIEITSPSNRITDALPGVTLDLKSADENTVVTINVAQNTSVIQTHVTNLITNFNAAIDYITENSSYNSDTEVAGLFLGDSTMMSLQSSLRTAIFSTVSGTETYNSLFSLGLSVSDTASLSINTSALQDAMEDNFDDVAKIFQTTGTCTNSKITFLSASSDTVETTSGYDVDITQAATQGSLVGTEIDDPAVTPLTIDDTNDELMLTIDGTNSQIMHLTHGDYTSGAQLAQEIQSQINSDEYLADKEVLVTWTDLGATGRLQITSQTWGSTSSVQLVDTANSSKTVLGLEGGTATAGTDVAGTINGEAATGTGRILRANSGNSTTDGIMLQVTLEPDDLGDGPEGSLTIVKGVAAKLVERLNQWADPVSGILKMRQDLADDQVESINTHIDRLEEILASRRQRLVDQFTAMEQALAAMQQQSAYLGIQLAQLTGQESE